MILSSPHFTPVKAKKGDIFKEVSYTTELFLAASNGNNHWAIPYARAKIIV
jgi:hypothetical protein